MSKVDDGGPAFPTDEYFNEQPIGTTPGMYLRDWFAGQALLACGNTTAGQTMDADLEQAIASAAYALADAMLAARKTER